MSTFLENAGSDLWEDLQQSWDGENMPSGVFSPDFCDLAVELRAPASEPLREVVQHLRDLGYLKSKEMHGSVLEDYTTMRFGPADQALLTEALLAYYADQDRFDEWFRYRLADGESGEPVMVYRDAYLARRLMEPLVLTFETISRLRALTSLDGKLEILAEPIPDEVSLRTRMIHHFLKLYGVLPETFPPRTPYGPETLAALRGLRALRGAKAADATLLQVLNGLTDFDTVALAFADQFESKSVWIPGPDQRGSWAVSIGIQKWAIRAAELPVRAVVVDAIDQPPAPNWVPPDWSVFGVRLLQIYLWHRGHYLGELDGLWGSDTQGAFISCLAAHELETAPGRKHSLWTVEKGYHRINTTAFIRLCQPLLPRDGETPDDLFAMQDAIRERLHELRTATTSSGDLEAAEQDAWTSVCAKLDKLDRGQDAMTPRRNYALGMIGRGIGRVLERLKQLTIVIKTKVMSFVRKVKEFMDGLVETISGAVLQAFRFLKRCIGSVMQTATLAARRLFRLVAGTPFVTTGSRMSWIVSRFSFDQDALTVAGLATTSDAVKFHFQEIESENRALEVSLQVGVKVLKIIAAFAAPVTGGYAALKLALAVFREVWVLFRDLQNPFTPAPRAITPRSPAARAITLPSPAPWRTGMLMAV